MAAHTALADQLTQAVVPRAVETAEVVATPMVRGVMEQAAAGQVVEDAIRGDARVGGALGCTGG